MFNINHDDLYIFEITNLRVWHDERWLIRRIEDRQRNTQQPAISYINARTFQEQWFNIFSI